MGRIRELINIFINPTPPEKSFDELAADANMSEANLKLLKNSMGGVSWEFADEVEETKKGKKPKVVTSKETQIQHQPESVTIEVETEIGDERD